MLLVSSALRIYFTTLGSQRCRCTEPGHCLYIISITKPALSIASRYTSTACSKGPCVYAPSCHWVLMGNSSTADRAVGLFPLQPAPIVAKRAAEAPQIKMPLGVPTAVVTPNGLRVPSAAGAKMTDPNTAVTTDSAGR